MDGWMVEVVRHVVRFVCVIRVPVLLCSVPTPVCVPCVSRLLSRLPPGTEFKIRWWG